MIVLVLFGLRLLWFYGGDFVLHAMQLCFEGEVCPNPSPN